MSIGPTPVQHNSVTSSGSPTSLAITLGTGITQGNLVVLALIPGDNTVTITAPDSSWHQATYNQPSGTSAKIATALYYLVVDSAHAGGTSWTWTISTGKNFTLEIEEWHSTTGWPANPLDQTANGDTGTPATSTTPLSGTTSTTGQAEELWIAALGYRGAAQTESSITSGWTKDLDLANGSNFTGSMLYNVASSTGAASCQYTIGTAQFWAGCVATFKDSVSNPVLSTSPTSLSFSASQGGSSPASQNDTLSETNGVATAWTSSISYGSGSGWLGISPSSGNLSANGNVTISVSPTTGSLTAGTYTATITFTATTGGATATISVTFVVNPPGSVLSVSPSTLSFSAAVGGANPATQNSILSETGNAATEWIVSIAYANNPGWLSINSIFIPRTFSGVLSGGNLAALGTNTIVFSCTTGTLALGTYNATVTFTSVASGSQATIVITFMVAASVLSTNPPTLSFSAILGSASPAAQTITLSETFGVGTAWTSTIVYPRNNNFGWLSILPTAGAYIPRAISSTLLGGNLEAFGHTTVTFTCALGILPLGTYTAIVTFTSPTSASMATVVVTFKVLVAPAYKITLAGQDITKYVDQLSLSIDDTLGQGSGAGSGGATQGRASTATFNTNLGPMNRAKGAGQVGVLDQLPNLYPNVVADASNSTSLITFDTTVTIDSTVFNTGTTSYKCVTAGTANYEYIYIPLAASVYQPNTTYTASLFIKGTNSYIPRTLAGTILPNTVRVYFVNNASGFALGSLIPRALSSTLLGSITTYNLTGSWQRVSVTFTTPGPLVYADFGFRIDTGAFAQAITYWVDSIMLEQTSTLFPWHLGTSQPTLVRQGEIIITDMSGTIIFGGYATKYTDTTTKQIGVNPQPFTTVEGIDYSTSLQRTIINEVMTSQSDIQVLNFLMAKYAPWISLQFLPTTSSYVFPQAIFNKMTLEQGIQAISGVTGHLVYVDYQKNFRYIPPTSASSAPFSLSDQPDFQTTFPHAVTDFTIDDNSAINRVFFYGGTTSSGNVTQDLSDKANGSNTIFDLAYSPQPTGDGLYHLTIGGAAQVVGIVGGQGTANQLKSAGGLADALVDTENNALVWNVAPATAAGGTILFTYRYPIPLNIVLSDENSHTFFGPVYLDGFIDDSLILDRATAVQRSKVVLSQQNYGLTVLKVDIYKAGIQAGMLLPVVNAVRGINASYLVQEVQVEPLGAGNFIYHITLGAWNWNLIDFLLKLPTLSSFADLNLAEVIDIVTILVMQGTNVKFHDSWAKPVETSNHTFYARSTAVGDGKDAYPGFSEVTS